MFKKGRWMGLQLYSPNNAQKNFLLYRRRPPGYHWRNTPKNLPHCTALTALQPIYTVHQESVGQLSNWCERMWAFWDKADLQAMAACSAVHSSMFACAQRLKQLVHITEMGNRKKPTALCFRRKKKMLKIISDSLFPRHTESHTWLQLPGSTGRSQELPAFK